MPGFDGFHRQHERIRREQGPGHAGIQLIESRGDPTGAEPGDGVGEGGDQGEQLVSRAYRDADGEGKLQAGSEPEGDVGAGEHAGPAVEAGRVPGRGAVHAQRC